MYIALRWLGWGLKEAEGWRDLGKVLEGGTRGCTIAQSCFGTEIVSWQLFLQVRLASKYGGKSSLTSLLRQRHLFFLRQLNHFHTKHAP